MSTQVRENSAKSTGPVMTAAEEKSRAVARPGKPGARELVTDLGRTSIADAVVAKIVGMAAREVPGVHAMGDGMTRAIGAVKDRIPGMSGTSVNRGVAVEVGQRQAAADLDLIAEYGVSIPDLADGVRRNVIAAVEKMCGLEVIEVNITVGDIHLPEAGGGNGGNGQPAEPRVQ